MAIAFVEVYRMTHKKIGEIKIAFAGQWKSIHPGLQHTLVGDLTLSNQFEALVGFNENGVYVPLAAKEWSISPDYRVFRFVIDTSRKFSDGSTLRAEDFKRSWEDSLKLDPSSSNNSLLDILYKVEGFSDFREDGTISGLKVIDDATLEVRFASPFRMALEQLSGNRFSAYRELNGKFIGTGAYIVEELGPELLKLRPNPYFTVPSKSTITLSTIDANNAVRDLADGKIEVVAYAMGATISADLENEKLISAIVGQDALHRALYTNNQKGRFFERRELRLALQYLIHEYLKNQPAVLGNPTFTTIDPQVYLPLQAGRLQEEEAEALIESGKQFVPELLFAAKKNPLVLIEPPEFSVKPILESFGLAVSPKSRTARKAEIIDIIYKGEEADIIPGSFGVASGDPDGIYHKLGKSGAIASPMTYNESVAKLLEEGRQLVQKDQVDAFYQGVSREILKEAPLIHMGFNKAVALYRNDKVKVAERILRRNEGHLHIFEEK
jgi:ABC-type transport system substrate-binding protein